MVPSCPKYTPPDSFFSDFADWECYFYNLIDCNIEKYRNLYKKNKPIPTFD